MSNPNVVAAIAPGPTNSVRSHDHPILESGNLSFPDGRYTLKFQPSEDQLSFMIEHHIENAPLIQRLLDSRLAEYACVVSSPISSYRRTHLSSIARQEVHWNAEDLGDPPLFTPAVLCVESQSISIEASRDGVHPIWDGQAIQLQKGARLARGSVFQTQGSILSLLSFKVDATVSDGQFVIDGSAEPFRFIVKMNKRLHQFLRFPRHAVRNHIMTHIVTACFAFLQREYGNNDGEAVWEAFPNLRALAEHLEAKGFPHWSEPDFHPERVATSLYPHVLPKIEEKSDEDR